MAEGDPARTKVMSTLMPVLTSAKSNVAVISPYFVPGENGTAALVKLVHDGRTVRVLTNSLVANDVAAVHGGYSRSRKPLLKGGVQIWELKPIAGAKSQSSLFGSSGASLHTKAFIVDNDTVFLGSYNLDPRSTWLNCEQGVLVENEGAGNPATDHLRAADRWPARMEGQPSCRRTQLDRRHPYIR